jgi:hypothetical protein
VGTWWLEGLSEGDVHQCDREAASAEPARPADAMDVGLLKLTFLSLNLSFLSLKLTFLSLKLTFRQTNRAQMKCDNNPVGQSSDCWGICCLTWLSGSSMFTTRLTRSTSTPLKQAFPSENRHSNLKYHCNSGVNSQY